MSTTTTAIKACSPAPTNAATTETNGSKQYAVMSKKLWDVGAQLTYAFLDGSDNQKNAVKITVPTWTTFANVALDFSSNTTAATFLISFKGQGSWSTVGTDANDVTTKNKNAPPGTTQLATMNLGWIADSATLSDEDKATILHEFGHALGMMHEHQSPARGEYIHLKELAVYKYYRPLLNYDDSLVKTQVIDTYNLSTISNYSHLDLKSIMMYSMPGDLNEEDITIPVNLVLSDLDKAFITLNYPKYPAATGGMSVTKALNIAGVPEDVSAAILLCVEPDKDGKQHYAKARSIFSSYNLKAMQMKDVNNSFLKGVDTTNHDAAQFGILDSIATFIQNPLFIGVVKNILNEVLVERATSSSSLTVTSVPGSAQRDVLNTIGTIITNPTFAQAIHDINTTLTGLDILADTTSTADTASIASST